MTVIVWLDTPLVPEIVIGPDLIAPVQFRSTLMIKLPLFVPEEGVQVNQFRLSLIVQVTFEFTVSV